jgi:hypothetical protein
MLKPQHECKTVVDTANRANTYFPPFVAIADFPSPSLNWSKIVVGRSGIFTTVPTALGCRTHFTRVPNRAAPAPGRRRASGLGESLALRFKFAGPGPLAFKFQVQIPGQVHLEAPIADSDSDRDGIRIIFLARTNGIPGGPATAHDSDSDLLVPAHPAAHWHGSERVPDSDSEATTVTGLYRPGRSPGTA